MNTQELIRESQRWLDIISAPELTEEQKARIQTDTVDNFNFYYNRGYLEYRKSVVEMREDPALEWAGEGSTFQDLSGRTYIDCLGGYGIYSAGIRHPKVVQAVADQLRRMPLSSQELLDPLRGALAELLVDDPADVDTLAAALVRGLDPSARPALAAAARPVAEEASLERSVDAIEGWCAAVREERGRGR